MADNITAKIGADQKLNSEELRTTLNTGLQTGDTKPEQKLRTVDSKPDDAVQVSDDEEFEDAHDDLTDEEETDKFLDASEDSSEAKQLGLLSEDSISKQSASNETKHDLSPTEIPSNNLESKQPPSSSAIHEVNHDSKQDLSNRDSMNPTSSDDKQRLEYGQGDADAFVNEALKGGEDGEDGKKDAENVDSDEKKDAEDEDSARLERESAMSEEEKECKRSEAQEHKRTGNDLFKKGEYLDSISEYTQALELCPLSFKKDRSIMFGNRGACHVRLEHHDDAIADCTKALDLNPVYLKVYLRRAQVYELTEKLDEALADFQKVFELDPSNYEARAACLRLPEAIKERNEKMKEEMMGKLKDLGNLVLRPFGLSTNNFQLNQDQNSGGYSVNFVQNPTNGK